MAINRCVASDFDGAKLIGKMITGDDHVLRLIAAYLLKRGETISPDRFLPGRKMPLGVVYNGIRADQEGISPEVEGSDFLRNFSAFCSWFA